MKAHTRSNLLIATATPALLLLFTTPAMAHVGHGSSSGLLSGLLHPFTGLDHLVALLGAGLLAWQGHAPRLILGSVLSAMALGALVAASSGLGMAAESLILASLFCLGGTLVLFGKRSLNPLPLAMSCGLFAFFHGAAHGLEVPASASLITYMTGFLASTLALVGGGFALGRFAEKLRRQREVQLGWATAALGTATLNLLG